MHLYFLTRGIKQDVDLFVRDLQAQYCQYNEKMVVQNSLRPIQLWEMVFPETYLKEMLKTITGGNIYNPKDYELQTGKIPMAIFRKILGAKKIPKLNLSGNKARFVYRGAVATYPIGIKKDLKWGKNPPPEINEGDELL